MGLFSKKRSAPPPGPQTFDGLAGREELAQLVMAFLQRAGEGRTEPMLDIAQRVFAAMPVTNPNAPVGGDFLQARWNWIAAVATRAEDAQDFELAGRIGLFCEVWNRGVLKEEPRYQMGRLVKVPETTEQVIYRAAFRSLARLDASLALVPGGQQGWSVAEALGQISSTVRGLPGLGVAIGPDLMGMATGDPEALGLERITARPMDMGEGVNSGDRLDKINDLVKRTIADSDRGDEAAIAYRQGGAIMLNGGDPRQALTHFERAAQLGHTDAMYDAGCILNNLGQTPQAHYWWQLAGESGHVKSAWNLAAGYAILGNREAARPWYVRCAELGDSRGYGALTQMARDDDDSSALLHWSRLGAAAGEQFCMYFFALTIMKEGGSQPDVADAIRYAQQAAEMGDVDSMFLAGLLNADTGNRFAAGRWLHSAQANGHARAGDVLAEYGL